MLSSLLMATQHTSEITGSAWAFHGPGICTGRACPIHRPSGHHMRDWPLLLPITAGDLVLERACPHGVAHPDPDSAAQAEALDQTHIGEHRLHACDGCCTAT